MSIINNRADILGLLFLDDGATMFITPLLNILVSGKILPVAGFNLLVVRVVYLIKGVNMEALSIIDLLISFKNRPK